MARKRTIDPDSWTDDKLADLSMYAHLLWVGLVSLADDDGRIEWSARQFKFRLFAVKPEATTETVSAWMAEIMDHGAIKVYAVDGKQYAYHPAWRKHQYVNKPAKSKIPPPPGFVPPEPPQKIEPGSAPKDESPREVTGIGETPGNPPKLPEKNQEDTKPQVPSGSVSGSVSGESIDSSAGPRKPEAPVFERFGDLEPDVVAYVANAAAENATGKITPGREATLRRELADELKTVGDRAAFLAGLRIANAAGVANPRYVRKAAITSRDRPAGAGKSRFPDEPNASDNLPTLADLVDAGLVESWTP